MTQNDHRPPEEEPGEGAEATPDPSSGAKTGDSKKEGSLPADSSSSSSSPSKSSPFKDPPPPSKDSLAILGVDGVSGEDEEDAPPWHDPMMPLEERMDLADGMDELSLIYASLGQTDCTSCGYESCRAYAGAIDGEGEEDLTLCIPGGFETEEKLNELREKFQGESEGSKPPGGDSAGNGNRDGDGGEGSLDPKAGDS